MKKRFIQFFICFLVANASSAFAADKFAFGFIAHPFGDALADEADLKQALAEADKSNLAFVVVGGIKSAIEPCSDKIYERRHALLEDAGNGVIVSLAASDWTDCRYSNGRSAALERLSRIRDLFFASDMSLGSSKIPIIRQSANVKFRDYAENVRWVVGSIMFATINLPSNNNHYLSAAGRNGEFEDRLIANKDWMQRLVTYAKRKRHKGIVIFCDGDPFAAETHAGMQRDGFKESRQALTALAAKFEGKILLIHNQPQPAAKSSVPKIQWRQNLGNLAVASDWVSVQVSPLSSELFTVETGANQ